MLLDVGCGIHPHPRAEVTCDLYFGAETEGGVINARGSKNFLICDAQHLPFKDLAFNESNCTHVLEHLENPKQGFRELKRVSETGYIEMPNTFYENILFGYPFHHWCFSKRNGSIYYTKPTKLKVNGITILPFGWFLHRLTLHKKFSSLVIPMRGLPLFYVGYRWS